jgi:hypothetical protein
VHSIKTCCDERQAQPTPRSQSGLALATRERYDTRSRAPHDNTDELAEMQVTLLWRCAVVVNIHHPQLTLSRNLRASYPMEYETSNPIQRSTHHLTGDSAKLEASTPKATFGRNCRVTRFISERFHRI